jgi:hypothetical protein
LPLFAATVENFAVSYAFPVVLLAILEAIYTWPAQNPHKAGARHSAPGSWDICRAFLFLLSIADALAGIQHNMISNCLPYNFCSLDFLLVATDGARRGWHACNPLVFVSR